MLTYSFHHMYVRTKQHTHSSSDARLSGVLWTPACADGVEANPKDPNRTESSQSRGTWFLVFFLSCRGYADNSRFSSLFRHECASVCLGAVIFRACGRSHSERCQGGRDDREICAPSRREQRRRRARHRAGVTFACTLSWSMDCRGGVLFMVDEHTSQAHTHWQWGSCWSNMSSWDESPHHHMSSSPTPPIPDIMLASIAAATQTLHHHHSLTGWKGRLCWWISQKDKWPPWWCHLSPGVVTWGEVTQAQVELPQWRKTPRQKSIKQGIRKLSLMEFYLKISLLLCWKSLQVLLKQQKSIICFRRQRGHWTGSGFKKNHLFMWMGLPLLSARARLVWYSVFFFSVSL